MRDDGVTDGSSHSLVSGVSDSVQFQVQLVMVEILV